MEQAKQREGVSIHPGSASSSTPHHHRTRCLVQQISSLSQTPGREGSKTPRNCHGTFPSPLSQRWILRARHVATCPLSRALPALHVLFRFFVSRTCVLGEITILTAQDGTRAVGLLSPRPENPLPFISTYNIIPATQPVFPLWLQEEERERLGEVTCWGTLYATVGFKGGKEKNRVRQTCLSRKTRLSFQDEVSTHHAGPNLLISGKILVGISGTGPSWSVETKLNNNLDPEFGSRPFSYHWVRTD